MKQEETDFGRKLQKEFDELISNITKPNILIAGGTGVGKSSIINMVFGEELAVVGTGKPVTQSIDVYENDHADVRIFDSKGYEMNDATNDEFFESVVQMANDEIDPQKAIHLIWYCIQASGGRATDYDFRALNEFTKANVPVAVVLTKTDMASEKEISEMRSVIPQQFQHSIFETSTELPQFNHIEELVEWSTEKLPEQLRTAFVKSQKFSLESKKTEAHKLVAEHSAAAFGVGFTPIPMSDAPILLANEAALIARILYLYGLDEVQDIIENVGIGAIIGSLVAQLGKAAVASLLKLIPGVGTAVGGLISGSVGATITGAIGESTSLVAYQICKAQLDGNTNLASDLISHFGEIVLKYAKEWIKSSKTID